MNIETFRNYCLSKKGVDESFPFGEDTLVFKVKGRMFALTGLRSGRFTVNLKCDPEKAIDFRELYPEIQPGFHMNKKHWNTVSFEESLGEDFLVELINHSYDLVVAKLPLKVRKELMDL